MKILQEKSQCCAAKIIRFGGKRRQCSACRKTWRVHPAKRGRKAKRRQNHYLTKVFRSGFTVKQLACHSRLSVAAIYKRFNRGLTDSLNRRRVIRIKGKKLILLLDAIWQYFSGELWTLYRLSVKSIDSFQATLLDPVLRLGKESASNWREMIDELPPGIKNRVIALVSDGIKGIETVTEDNGWLIQRCHFHLLGLLYKMRGKRAATPGRLVREKICCLVKLALRETSARRLNNQCGQLAKLAKHPKCPKRMRKIVRDFLRRIEEFRAYLEYPELRLPTTTNVMESANSVLRRKVKTVNSPQSWHKWALAVTRFKSKFTCE